MNATTVYVPVRREATVVPHARSAPLVALAKRLHALGLTPAYGPGDHGNLSCRAEPGCLISARESSKATMRDEDIAHAIGYEEHGDAPEVTYDGRRAPSTDAFMHLKLYALRPELGAIIHAHDAETLLRARQFGVPMTTVSARTNSRALVEDVCRVAQRANYVLLRDHGCLAVGRTLEEAEAELMRWYRKARGRAE